jgi:hypothetical protein
MLCSCLTVRLNKAFRQICVARENKEISGGTGVNLCKFPSLPSDIKAVVFFPKIIGGGGGRGG